MSASRCNRQYRSTRADSRCLSQIIDRGRFASSPVSGFRIGLIAPTAAIASFRLPHATRPLMYFWKASDSGRMSARTISSETFAARCGYRSRKNADMNCSK